MDHHGTEFYWELSEIIPIFISKFIFYGMRGGKSPTDTGKIPKLGFYGKVSKLCWIFRIFWPNKGKIGNFCASLDFPVGFIEFFNLNFPVFSEPGLDLKFFLFHGKSQGNFTFLKDFKHFCGFFDPFPHSRWEFPFPEV